VNETLFDPHWEFYLHVATFLALRWHDPDGFCALSCTVCVYCQIDVIV
jgi:hypothetical protein